MPVSVDDAALVLAARSGDGAAFGTLFERWADRCYDVARRIVHDDGRAAEVTQDVFLAAWQQIGTLRDPAAFGGWVLRASRNKALNRLEREARSTQVAGDAPLLLDRTDGASAGSEAEAAMSADELQALVAAASAVLGERDASVLDLHLRHGMGAPEIAAELDVTPNNAHQLLFRMKRNLAAGVRAWVLVKGGRPSCEGLRVSLETAGIDRFGRDAAKVIGRHVDDCEDCTRRQAAVLDPAALFATAPVLVMAPALRRAVADGLQAQGVPVGGEAPPTSPPAPPADVTDPPPPPSDAGDPPPTGRRRRRGVLAVVVLALIAAVIGIGVAASDGEEDLTTTGTSVPAPTTEPAATTDDPDPAGATTTGVLPAPTAPSTTAGTLVASPHPTEPRAGTTAPVPSTFAPNPATPTAPPPAAPTTTAAPAPTVDSFTATALGEGGSCTNTEWGTRLSWTTTHATAVSIAATTVATQSGLAPDGSRTVCRPTPGMPPGGWKLTATGPGGTASATA